MYKWKAGDTEKEIETLHCVPPPRYHRVSPDFSLFAPQERSIFCLSGAFGFDGCFTKQHETPTSDSYTHVLPVAWHYSPFPHAH